MATSYSNNGGFGDRTTIVPLTTDISIGGSFSTSMNNGATLESACWFNGVAVADKYIKWSFPCSVVIDEFKFYQQTGNFFLNMVK